MPPWMSCGPVPVEPVDDNLKQLLWRCTTTTTLQQFPLPAAWGQIRTAVELASHILPFVDAHQLYNSSTSMNLGTAAQQALIDKMPSVYRHPVSQREAAGRTTSSRWQRRGLRAEKPTRMQDIKDGTSNTLMIVEVDDEHAVIWTKPEDWIFDPKTPQGTRPVL